MEISNTDISTFINMVDTFYNNAWNRLVLYGALIIVSETGDGSLFDDPLLPLAR